MVMILGETQEPFVGRTAELDALAGAFARAAVATGVVWVEGPAGIGKTALVRAFLAAAPALVSWAAAMRPR